MHDTDRMLRYDAVEEVTGLDRVTIWRLERAGRFPRRRRLTARSVGWLASEVQEWLDSRPVVEIGVEDGSDGA